MPLHEQAGALRLHTAGPGAPGAGGPNGHRLRLQSAQHAGGSRCAAAAPPAGAAAGPPAASRLWRHGAEQIPPPFPLDEDHKVSLTHLERTVDR